MEVIGFPLVIDWATSVISTGKVQQLSREGLPLPPNAAVDSEGNVTTDPVASRGHASLRGAQGLCTVPHG